MLWGVPARPWIVSEVGGREVGWERGGDGLVRAVDTLDRASREGVKSGRRLWEGGGVDGVLQPGGGNGGVDVMVCGSSVPWCTSVCGVLVRVWGAPWAGDPRCAARLLPAAVEPTPPSWETWLGGPAVSNWRAFVVLEGEGGRFCELGGGWTGFALWVSPMFWTFGKVAVFVVQSVRANSTLCGVVLTQGLCRFRDRWASQESARVGSRREVPFPYGVWILVTFRVSL